MVTNNYFTISPNMTSNDEEIKGQLQQACTTYRPKMTAALEEVLKKTDALWTAGVVLQAAAVRAY